MTLTKAHPHSIFSRFVILLMLSGMVWGLIYLSDHSTTSTQQIAPKNARLPPFKTWKTITLTRPGWPAITLLQDHQQEWWVGNQENIEISKQISKQHRRVDPLLSRRLLELDHLAVLEERNIESQVAKRALGLSEVALTLTLGWKDEKGSSISQETKGASLNMMKIRLGAEHLRHSTWIAQVDSTGKVMGKALRVQGRLRRSFDHEPHRWPDRRVSHLSSDEITRISCQRGALHHQANQQENRVSPVKKTDWHLVRSLEHTTKKWVLDEEGNSPLLDQAATHTLSYTLSTLRFDRLLESGELLTPWRPTHTYTWQGSNTKKEWLSVGHTRIKGSNSTILIGESSIGLGVISQHLDPFLSPQLTTLLKRAPLPSSVTGISQVVYLAPPSPLDVSNHQINSASDQGSLAKVLPSNQSWSMEKRTTGWWLTHPKKIPINAKQAETWLKTATRESASARRASLYLPKATTDQILPGAELHFTVVEKETCLLMKRQPPCQFTLIQQGVNHIGSITNWLRVEDQTLLSLSQQHQQMLTQVPIQLSHE